MRGCTIIFTSPQQKNYDSVWKQAEGRSKRYFMPVWSEEEVLNHWKAGGILQICKEEADVKKAYSMIGGSVRYLHKLLVAVAENKTTLEEEAKQMIRDCVVKCTFEDLCQAADSGGADMDAQNNRSKMSRVLHIHSDAKFQTPNVKLIESEVVLNILCDQLAEKQRKALPDLIRASLNITPLGTLCGRLFQMHVAEVCKSKKVELVCTALKTNKDKTESAAVKICIPTLQKMLKKLGDQPPPKPLPEFDENCLYCPESEAFPAADLFFVTKEGKNITLWLLQVTKAKSHDCKIGASYKQFKIYFQLNGVKTINWVVVAPEGDIAEGYALKQKVVGTWDVSEKCKFNFEQYVSSWKATDVGQEQVVHGTFLRHWLKIRSEGLRKMSRNHIHLCLGLPGSGVVSGMREDCNVAIFVNLAAAGGPGRPWSRA
ncbi:unnamed protein product [Effrenium voratum]|nr:unnamed protein product [Effrenium voratum]